MKFYRVLAAAAVVALVGRCGAEEPAPAAFAGSPRQVTRTEIEINRFVRDLQDDLEASGFGGTFLTGGTAVARQNGSDGSTFDLALRGRIAHESDRQRIRDLADEFVTQDPFARQHIGSVVVDRLRVVPMSEGRAVQSFAYGLEAFDHGDYAVADVAFAVAAADEPGRTEFRYWRVVTALALGDQARAEARLRPLIRRNEQGSGDRVVAASFERVQGPLRLRLTELERRVRLGGTAMVPAESDTPRPAPEAPAA